MHKEVWIFMGEESMFASGVFSKKETAATWIKKNKLTGVLTIYPIDIGVYEWAIDNDIFVPSKAHHSSPSFIQAFTSASMEHYHFENGEQE